MCSRRWEHAELGVKHEEKHFHFVVVECPLQASLQTSSIYPLGMNHIENGPVEIVSFPNENGDIPELCQRLPEGNHHSSRFSRHLNVSSHFAGQQFQVLAARPWQTWLNCGLLTMTHGDVMGI